MLTSLKITNQFWDHVWVQAAEQVANQAKAQISNNGWRQVWGRIGIGSGASLRLLLSEALEESL